MIAAIYARKSNEQTGVPDGEKSVDRQIAHARAYAEKKGWTVADAHIYCDDGISGAEFKRRPGYLRLMNALTPRAPFQVLVMSEGSRLGREMFETAYALKQLDQAGVEVWLYLEDRRRTLNSATDKLLLSVTEFAAEIEKEKASQRVTDAMHRKFDAGHVTGSKVFGYDNVRVDQHSERHINPVEAAVVREVYERYARGEGFRAIAWALNQRGLPAPRAQQGRPSGWEPSTIRSLLDRPLYRGRVVWNRSRKRTAAWGEKQQRPRPETEWKIREAPELRIIEDALAAAVDVRRGDRAARYLRATNGQLIGRPAAGAKYLLSGLLICPCGARFEALKGGNWTHPGVAVYVCAARRRKGPSVCPHNHAFPIEATDDRILSVIEGAVLSPAFIDRVLDTAFSAAPDEGVALQTERARLVREIENLTAAIAEGGDIPRLVAVLKDRDKRLKSIDARLAPKETPDRETLRLALEQRVNDWREKLRKNPKQGRMVLQQLVEPLVVHSDENRPRWLAQPRPQGLLVGMVQVLASPTGFEPVFWP